MLHADWKSRMKVAQLTATTEREVVNHETHESHEKRETRIDDEEH